MKSESNQSQPGNFEFNLSKRQNQTFMMIRSVYLKLWLITEFRKSNKMYVNASTLGFTYCPPLKEALQGPRYLTPPYQECITVSMLRVITVSGACSLPG